MTDEYDTDADCPACGATVDVLVVLDRKRCPECHEPRAELFGTANDPDDVAGETPDSHKPEAVIDS